MLSGVNRSAALIVVGGVVGVALIAYGAQRLASHKPTVPAEAPAAPTRAVVATKAIARGHRIEAADISANLMETPPVGAVSTAEAAIGRIAVSDIPAKQVVLGSALAADANALGLAALVPVGYRAISIQTSDEIAVSNLLRPGDIVDVQMVLGDAVLAKGATLQQSDRSEASTLLQAVRVVSVGEMLGQPPPTTGGSAENKPPPARTMTLAMSPDQVAQFTLARSLGAFYLALRNPDDKADAPRATARLPDIRPAGAVTAAAFTGPRPVSVRRPRAAASTQGVELVVGGESHTIYPQ